MTLSERIKNFFGKNKKDSAEPRKKRSLGEMIARSNQGVRRNGIYDSKAYRESHPENSRGGETDT